MKKLSRVERLLLTVDWERTWNLVNIRGINGEQRSFLMKVIYNILPSNARLFRMNQSLSPNCDLCLHGPFQDLAHSMLECDFNGMINDWVTAVLLDIDPGLLNSVLSSINIVTLNLQTDGDMHVKLAVVWFLSKAMQLLWQAFNLHKII